MTGDYARIVPRAVTPKRSAPEPKLLADSGDAGAIEVVRIEDLHRDMAYQRAINQQLVDEIARTWDIAAAGPIVVSRRKNGDLYIVNGQHRTAAAKQAGEREIIAQVINGLTPREEAILRLKGNRRRTDTPMERFAAQIAAGDVETHEIRRIVESLGGRVNSHPDQATGINAISALEAIYRKDGGTLLVRTLELLRDGFGSLDGPCVSVNALKAAAWFLEQHGGDGASRARMVERMQTLGPLDLARRARDHKAVNGGSMWTNYYRAMLVAYNERLSPSRRLEMRLSGSSLSMGGGGRGD